MSLCRYRSLQKYLCQINKIIPTKIWPLENTLAPWDKDNPLTPIRNTKQLKPRQHRRIYMKTHQSKNIFMK
ncbi:hypothetical protein Godav_000176 [Gossypium davidsonii]|uniref:Uncharacterized protein n=1 Tax=Gossypium davidsonii TaxID=34287 RepID=A0A7J8TDZ2_GOSDV|nr:hypothetical protein [Gossypium davidsonii]